MKRSVAVKHVRELVQAAATQCAIAERSAQPWPLQEVWVAGDLLGVDHEFEHGDVVLVFDLPAKELPWLALHPVADWVAQLLGLAKRPIRWSYRPRDWPAWNLHDRRVVRVWRRGEESNEVQMQILGRARPDMFNLTEPSDDEVLHQLTIELGAAHEHLRFVVDRYWDPQWRREQTGYSCDDVLWRAAGAVADLADAVANLDGCS